MPAMVPNSTERSWSKILFVQLSYSYPYRSTALFQATNIVAVLHGGIEALDMADKIGCLDVLGIAFDSCKPSHIEHLQLPPSPSSY